MVIKNTKTQQYDSSSEFVWNRFIDAAWSYRSIAEACIGNTMGSVWRIILDALHGIDRSAQ